MLEVGDGVLLAPLVKKLLGHILNAACFLMTTHTKGHALDKYRLLVLYTILTRLSYCLIHFQYVIPIYGDPLHAIAHSTISQLLTDELLT